MVVTKIFNWRKLWGNQSFWFGIRTSGKQWMYLNGVIMVSPADYKFFESDPAISSALNLPYFTAAAWYHKMLPEALQQKDLLEVLPESEDYALNHVDASPGQRRVIVNARKEKVAEKMSYYSGLSTDIYLGHNLDVPTQFFWKDLLRDHRVKPLGDWIPDI